MKFALFPAKFFMICALCAAFNCSASAKDDWLRLQSKNFQLVGNATEADLRASATRLEQFRDVFTRLFPNYKFASPIPTRVVVFKDKTSFDQFKPIEWATGYFQPGEDINYIVLCAEGNEAARFPTVFHEYTHFLIDNSLGRTNVPPWFNEGIAEYYERFAIENDQNVTFGAANAGNLQLLQRNQLIPFENFFATDYYTLHHQTKESAQHFYAQSWALMHYFLHDKNGERKPQLDKFIELSIAGIKPKDAFQQAFQMNYAALETEFRKYIAQKILPQKIVQLSEKLVFDGQMSVSTISEAEAKAFQGDLLFHTKQYEKAEKILDEALALDANSSTAFTTLGLVRLEQKRYWEARTLLEKAVRTDTKNYLAFYNYAYALVRENTTEFGFAIDFSASDADKIRENLKKAISLNPNYAESYNLFAFVNIVRNEFIDESTELIGKALEIAPGNQRYGLRLAELYFRKEKFADARDIARKIMATAADEQTRIYAENTLKNINSLEAQLEDLKNYRKREQNDIITEIPLSDEEIARRREKAMMESLNETLRKPRINEKRMLGYVTKIECVGEQTIFSIKSDDRNLLLRTNSLETVTLISFAPELVKTNFGCGSAKTENLSVITFRPKGDEKSNIVGEIVAVEFVPKNFRFLSAVK